MNQKQTEQKPKNDKARCCMECGDSHSTLHKVKKRMEQKDIFVLTALKIIVNSGFKGG